MASGASVTVRKMSRPDLEIAVEWAAREGWNPGLHDAECFWAADPDGFFMAWAGDRPVGSISAVAYDGHFGFVGFFIVDPEWRGHRVGVDLGRAGLGYLGNRLIGLDGVEAKIRNYEDFGFQLAYPNARYEGRAAARGGRASGCVALSDVPLAEVSAFDRTVFPATRDAFLERWISRPGTVGWAIRSGTTLSGYGAIRPCRRGYKIGPLCATRSEMAGDLMSALAGSVPEGAPIFLDVPVPNASAVGLAESWGMSVVFRTARMYNRAAPAVALDHVYGVTSFELG